MIRSIDLHEELPALIPLHPVTVNEGGVRVVVALPYLNL